MAKPVVERGRRGGDRRVASVFSHEDSLWLSKFTWPGGLERYDIDWMQINVSNAESLCSYSIIRCGLTPSAEFSFPSITD